MKKLKFRHHLAEEIIAGKKTTTWRLFDEKDLGIGDKLELLDSESGEKFAEAEIVIVREKKLGQIEGEDLKGHEKFGSKEEMLKMFKKYYGEKVNYDTPVKIIEFKLL